MVMCVLLCYKRGRHIRHLGLEACGNLTSNGVKRLAGLQELTHLNLNQVSPEGMGPALGRLVPGLASILHISILRCHRKRRRVRARLHWPLPYRRVELR